MKSESVIDRRKKYYKLSNFDSANGVLGHESVNEIIVDRLPEYVSRRKETNAVDCVLLEDCRLLCFFANEEVKKIDLDRLKNSGDVDKIINNERSYRWLFIPTDTKNYNEATGTIVLYMVSSSGGGATGGGVAGGR